ncbi:MAG: 1-aminocyclopropane-carboxylate deaminase/D-cysteine desulfhydrase [Ferruginibacter sp.]|nr:1-aminocyclopropane-carboxylate deaminase/D-cysteine desulfhydrase [Ferruginibacter sp.]
MLLPGTDIRFDELIHPELTEKQVRCWMARLDEIHPVISGNKLFKLHYFLEEALQSTHKTVLTFGGAYSNHLVATAFAANQFGLKSIGLVRGGEPEKLSPTLLNCMDYGMRLHYLPREIYAALAQNHIGAYTEQQFGPVILIPEGGASPAGARGASLMLPQLSTLDPTHICTAVGTATTLAGLLNADHAVSIVGVPVIKGMTDIPARLDNLLPAVPMRMPLIWDQYHFGGYAKKTEALLDFMNEFYHIHQIPLDFVYTAKLMYGLMEKVREGYFKSGDRIVCLHTGGLQGNRSLKEGRLIF